MATNTVSRRTVLVSSALMAVPALAQAPAADPRGSEQSASRVLVAYLSRSGNTRVIAGQIRRATGGTEFEIRPREPYPEDYEETVEQARRERDAGFEPELAATVPDIASYETVYLGFPIWGGTAPPPIRSFLSAHDLSDKDVIPFITHGGYGLGGSEAVLAERARGARLAPAFSMEADQERRTLEMVTSWLRDAAPDR